MNGKVLLSGTVVLYLSTTTYMVALIWSWANRNYYVAQAFAALSSPLYDGADANAALRAIRQQSWMLTVGFGLNFIIGDAIVWWRACVIWQRKVVTFTGPILIFISIVMHQSSDSPNVCTIIGMATLEHVPNNHTLYIMIAGNAYGIVALILSFSTNVLATTLIGYKAWQHRQLLKQHFAEGRATSRVLKALALLTESGCIYCAILVLIFAPHTGCYYLVPDHNVQILYLVYEADPSSNSDNANFVFETVGNDFEYGCLVPLIAIYPTTIIAIVALKQSPIDAGGLSRPRQARRHGSALATAEGGTTSTVVFHHSMGVRSSAAAVETQGSVAGPPAPCMHSLETLTSQEKIKAAPEDAVQ
ncbi:hypothetical protein GSI_07353 [Ganoderma sinense ZZ0214-1]|uniref:Uncharacterized protein n=1 Tax=Ganoderma sinense ZZ0214-1 TaxID=1077348 RepID=A0A2G8SA81_9APHY|nr:hypothetical protein GSI_07353 [Ganoderma sinense ZZ0214-1]